MLNKLAQCICLAIPVLLGVAITSCGGADARFSVVTESSWAAFGKKRKSERSGIRAVHVLRESRVPRIAA